MMEMTIEEKRSKCAQFFNDLSEALSDSHTVMESCNQDFSKYLVPNGTEDLVTYSGKPSYSFRISDHWNWYANLNKCSNEHYIQCLSTDLPRARKRFAPGKPSKPITGIQVAVIGDDGKYHAVYGEVYSRALKEWKWLEGSVEDAANLVMNH